MTDINSGSLDTLRGLLDDYRIAQAVAVACELGIPKLVADHPKSIDEVIQATGTDPRSLSRLLRALISIGVFAQLSEGQIAASPLLASLRLVALDPVAIRAVAGGLPHERESWGHLRHTIKTRQSAFRHLHGQSSWDYHAQQPDRGEVLHVNFSRGTQQWAHAILAPCSFANAECVIDVGGGQGALIAAILQAHPQLRGILLDQPSVVRGALPLLKEAGVADRCAIIAGDFFVHVPAGAISTSRRASCTT
jgi:hypothetical protein